MKINVHNPLVILAPFYIAAAVILFMPLGHSTASTFSPFDSYIHTILFGTLGLVTFLTYSEKIRITAWSLVIFAAYSEIIQSFIPTRTTDVRDLFNDCIGIIIALLVFSLINQNFTKEAPKPVTRKKKTIKKKKSRPKVS